MNGGDNLPHPLTSFVGRRRERRELRRKVLNSRLVTLIGPGGAGKTRLAIEVARDLLNEFADGVCLAELAPVSDGRLIYPTVASALGVHEQPGRPLAATLSDYLTDKQLLLVVDNSEHLAAEVASLLEPLLRRSPSLRVLVTSRAQLGVSGEQAWAIPELADHEALSLFASRAAQVQPDFAVTPEMAPLVAEICRRLDGLPLAIELAAARFKTLSVSEIAGRLDDRFRLLTAGSRTALPQHQTLTATMEWSYDLLPKQAAILWRRLAVFAGGLTLDAAEAICSDDQLDQKQILELLTILVESSLLRASQAGDHTRFQMLESIREYGWLKLREAHEDQAFRRRHLEYFLGLARQVEPEWRGPNQGVWLSRLDEELDNIRAALDSSSGLSRLEDGMALASALWLFWVARGHLGESRLWLDTLLAGAGTTRARAYALNVAGFLAYVQGDTAAAVPLLEESLRLNEALGDRAGANFALLRLGIGLYYNNDLDRAITILEESNARYREAGDRVGMYVSGYELGEALTMLGDLKRGRPLLEESLALKKEQGDRWHIAQGDFGFGLLEWREGNHRQGVRWLQKAIALHHELDDLWGLNRAVEALAWVEGSAGDLLRAAHLLSAAAAMLERSGTGYSLNYRIHHEEWLAKVRAGLSTSAFETAWNRGRALSRDELVQYAVKGRTTAAGHRQTGGVSRREEQIAGLVAVGLTNRQIAAQLSLAERTVDAHVEHIMNKLGYRSRAQIAAWITSR